jgi:hypothetical protein
MALILKLPVNMKHLGRPFTPFPLTLTLSLGERG